jgi:hypothetical protein
MEDNRDRVLQKPAFQSLPVFGGVLWPEPEVNHAPQGETV